MEVAEKSNSSGTPDFTGENTLERETLCFFGSSGLWGHRSRVSVSAAAGLDVDKKANKTVARSRFWSKRRIGLQKLQKS